jgi:hypothetical protein
MSISENTQKTGTVCMTSWQKKNLALHNTISSQLKMPSFI